MLMGNGVAPGVRFSSSWPAVSAEAREIIPASSTQATKNRNRWGSLKGDVVRSRRTEMVVTNSALTPSNQKSDP